MKPRAFGDWSAAPRVALRAGAWIETPYQGDWQVKGDVALRAGAWIETQIKCLLV